MQDYVEAISEYLSSYFKHLKIDLFSTDYIQADGRFLVEFLFYLSFVLSHLQKQLIALFPMFNVLLQNNFGKVLGVVLWTGCCSYLMMTFYCVYS